MKPFVAVLLAITLASSAWAALPPRYQNQRDLDALLAFVHAHPEVLEQLRRIDLEHREVHYGDGCVASFTRGEVPPIPGPAPPLRFDRSTCPLRVD